MSTRRAIMKSLLTTLASLAMLTAVSTGQAQPFAYITNQNSDNVSVINTTNNTVVATVPVGLNPKGVAVNPVGARVYVANFTSNTVSVIATASNNVVATIAVGTGPLGVAVNPAGTRVYVTNYNSGNVSVIDTATDSVVATMPVGVLPWGVAVNPAGTRVYVANFNSSTVSVIDTATSAVATVAVFGARSVAVNPAGTRVYVAKSNGTVAVIDTANNSVVATVTVGGVPQTVAVNAAGTRVYVTNSDNISDGVLVIDTANNTVVNTVGVGSGPEGIAVTGTRAYVANFGSNNVSVIDTTTNAVVATVPVGSNPVAFGLFVGLTPLTLTAVRSRKDHGSAGTHDLPINTSASITGNVTVEPRVIGTGHRIVFVFTGTVTAMGSATAVNGAGQLITANVSTSGSEVTVTLPNVPDNSRALITLSGVNGTAGATAAVGFLVGDVNSSRSVNSIDISAVKARSGQATTAANFMFDLSVSGAITAADISAVKARLGATLPGNFTAGATLAVDASPLRLSVVPDATRTVTQTIPVTGGTITATGADGTVYTLAIPADALLVQTAISMTPAASLDSSDIAKDAAYGVELGPAGATFHNFVTLTITPPATASVPIARQLPIGWSGTQNVISLAAIDPTSMIVKLKLLHFSGYALLLATKGTNATLAPVRHRLGGDAEARLQSLAGERLTQERQRQLDGNPDTMLALEDIFRQYDEQVVKPRIAAAGTSCAAGRLALETVLGAERQKQLLGMAVGSFADTILPIIAVATDVCTREEYALCRDNHIITRILPYYLGVQRQAELLGIAGNATTLAPAWLQDAEAAVGKCLNFELQLNSRLNYSIPGGISAHSISETVESRVKLPFNIGVALFDQGYISSSLGFAPLVSLAYDVNYPHACASVSDVQRIGAGMGGMLGYTPEAGGVAQRAMVKDFYLTLAVMPNGAGSGYTLTTRPMGSTSCENPPTTTRENENWVNMGFGTWAQDFIDPELGMAIRNWTIVASDIMATKDFTTSSSSGSDSTVTTTNLILFHKPAP